MIWHDKEPVPRPVKPNLRDLSIPDSIFQNQHRERVEYFTLDGSIERPGAVCGRVSDRAEVVLGRVVKFELDFARGEAVFYFAQPDVDDLGYALQRKSALQGRRSGE